MRLRAALLLGALLAAPASAEKLQLYVMPDTQAWARNFGGDSLAHWRAVANALCAQKDRFAYVLHTGDLVDDPGDAAQWRNAVSVMKQLDACGLPHAIAFGNHDFDNYPNPPNVLLQGDHAWRAAVGQLAQHAAATGPSGRTSLHALAPAWFLLATDFVWSPKDRAWLDEQIAARPGARFLLLNHHCVKTSGVAFDWCRQLFDGQPAIRVALSGHWLGPVRDAWRSAPRPGPRQPALVTLYQNYQHVPSLASWGVVVELDTKSGALCVWSEDLVSGNVGRPAVAKSQLGPIEAGQKKTCFDAAGRGPR